MDFTNLRGVLFDKDGTLFDFQKSWGAMAREVLAELSAGDDDLAQRLGDRAGVDATNGQFRDHSPIVAGRVSDIVTEWATMLPGWSPQALERLLNQRAIEAASDLAPASDDLPALLDRLRAGGLTLGVATHDGAAAADAQLAAHGVRDQFAFVAGYDSGYAPKPDPAMLRAFAAAIEAPTSAILVIGDSRHDLGMGRSGGARASIGVLTGPAPRAALEDSADLILPSIDALPELLGL